MPREGRSLDPDMPVGPGDDVARLAVFVAGGSAWLLDARGQVTGRYGPVAGGPAPMGVDGADLRVADARQVPELRERSEVHGPPEIRALSRMSIVGPSGASHGALILADTVPRLLSVDRIEALAALCAQTGRMLEAEHRANHGWRTVVAHLGPPVFVLSDREGRLVVVGGNPAAEKLAGTSGDRLYGRTIHDVFPWVNREGRHDRGGIVEACRRVLFGGEPEEMELVFNAPSGGRLVHQLRMFLLVPGFVGVSVQDLSLQRDLERRREEFMATVAHELRTPLSSVRGAIGLLMGGVAGPMPDSAQRLLGLAREGTDRLDRLVRDLLDLERLRAGLLPMRLEPLDVADLVNTAASALSATARGAGVIIQVNTWRAARLSGDRERLAQAVANLIGNAVRFAPSGTVVEVSVTGPSDWVRISVRDAGRAPTEEELRTAFEPRAPGGDARRGSGPGLLITRLVVQGHAGSVGLAEGTGGGAELWMDLPVLSGVAG